MPTHLDDPRTEVHTIADDAPPVSSTTGPATAWVLGLLLVVAALVGAAWLWTLSISTIEETTSTFEDVTALQLDIDHGTVTVAPSDSALVTVHEQLETTIRPIETSHQLDDNGTLELSSQSCGAVAFGFFNQCSAHFTVSVPDGVNISGATGHGSIEATGLTSDIDLVSRHGRLDFQDITGDVAAQTRHGAVELHRVSGSVNVETSHGRIDAYDLDGPLTANSRHGAIELSGGTAETVDIFTTHGRIEIVDIASERVDATTNHGAVQVQPTTHPEHIDLNTSHGSISVILPADPPPYTVNASTNNGDEEIGLPSDPSAEHRLTAETNHGSITVGIDR